MLDTFELMMQNGGHVQSQTGNLSFAGKCDIQFHHKTKNLIRYFAAPRKCSCWINPLARVGRKETNTRLVSSGEPLRDTHRTAYRLVNWGI